MNANRVPASLTPAEGYIGVRCETCNAPPGRVCWTWQMEPTQPHARRAQDAGVAAWWHCFWQGPESGWVCDVCGCWNPDGAACKYGTDDAHREDDEPTPSIGDLAGIYADQGFTLDKFLEDR